MNALIWIVVGCLAFLIVVAAIGIAYVHYLLSDGDGNDAE